MANPCDSGAGAPLKITMTDTPWVLFDRNQEQVDRLLRNLPKPVRPTPPAWSLDANQCRIGTLALKIQQIKEATGGAKGGCREREKQGLWN
jgi:hypothetical protein